MSFVDDLARDAFLALVLAAAALMAGELATGPAGFDAGRSVVLAVPVLLAIVVGPQVALVPGTPAAWRAWARRLRHRRAVPLPRALRGRDAEVALVRRWRSGSR